MNEVRYRRQLAIHFSEKETSMPYALCPMPYALCPMPYAHEHLQKPEKGYND